MFCKLLNLVYFLKQTLYYLLISNSSLWKSYKHGTCNVNFL